MLLHVHHAWLITAIMPENDMLSLINLSFLEQRGLKQCICFNFQIKWNIYSET